ncbi:MAG: hypothetical protein JO097_21255 [Acidobacteriaceae bacterium]|nr:hypothetical protein [Acidobacteriaceae bacterium]MBV9763371.1 hypothetical protein [Acidobacteriaceae bacterium]
MYAREWASRLFVIGVAALIFIACVIGLKYARTPEVQARYYLWPFQKPNTTALDRYRAEQHLKRGLLDRDSKYVQIVRTELAERLRFEMLPLDTADRMLKLLYENSSSAPDNALIADLADSLRTNSADLRTRTEKILIYLADERRLSIPQELRNWKPSKEDAATCVDTIAHEWANIANASSIKPDSLNCIVGSPSKP